jgi:flagellar L-ring protein precursor FlgH
MNIFAINYRLSHVTLFIILTQLMACVPDNVKPDDPEYAPVLPTPKVIAPPQNGSLYQEYQGLSLFGNTNNHRVGDIITVMLDERTVSQKSSGVAIDKESDIDLRENGNNTFFGRDTDKDLPVVGNASVPLNSSQSREFSGDASADQSNSLEGNISVTITEILSNGNFIVKGEKWLTLNRGDEYIRISGMVRKEDVTLGNTISSTKLANARISYSGTGDLANSQKMGWLGKFFNSILWPF